MLPTNYESTGRPIERKRKTDFQMDSQSIQVFLESVYLYYKWCYCLLATVKSLTVLHYSVAYIFWFFVVAEPIPGFLKI